MKKRPRAVVILGPTSSGKSNIAIKLARELNGEVISADSRQIYRHLNLGTGKVKGAWGRKKGINAFYSEGVAHHLIDFVPLRNEYNVSHFKLDCEKLIEEITNRGRLPIICGGTGFWISAVVDNIILPQVSPDKELRAKLILKSAGQLHAKLEKLDPERARTIDKGNKLRLIRAIEICRSLGKVPRPNHSQFANRNSQFLLIGIDWPQPQLDQKIKKRLQTRWTAGMIKEVENLNKRHRLSWKRIQSFGLGYYWIPQYLKGKIDLEQLREKVFRAERGYAKRQRTWFKRDKRILWLNEYHKIKKLVAAFAKK